MIAGIDQAVAEELLINPSLHCDLATVEAFDFDTMPHGL